MKIEIVKSDNPNWIVNAQFADILKYNGINSPEDLWNLSGESVKKFLKERGTERAFLKTPDGGQIETYIKRYLPLPFKEYYKSFISLKPIFKFGAIHEWQAIVNFHSKNIPTMQPIAAGILKDGKNINITLGITDYKRASDLFASGISKNQKLQLIKKIAKLAGKMHSEQFAHQDFYLVHLFVTNKESLVLPIDLQRLLMGKQFSKRWQIKDLAQLLYSAKDYISNPEILLFWKIYTSLTDPKLFDDKKFIKKIQAKAARIKNRSDRKKKRKNE